MKANETNNNRQVKRRFVCTFKHSSSFEPAFEIAFRQLRSTCIRMRLRHHLRRLAHIFHALHTSTQCAENVYESFSRLSHDQHQQVLFSIQIVAPFTFFVFHFFDFVIESRRSMHVPLFRSVVTISTVCLFRSNLIRSFGRWCRSSRFFHSHLSC